MRKLRNYKPTPFMAKNSIYSKAQADMAVDFIQCLCHTKGTWAGKPFELIKWQEQIIRDLFGIIKPNGYRQFNTAYIEIPKKMGKSELAAAVALLLTCGDGEERAEVYGCAADRQQASIVFEVAADMVRMCPALSKRVKILAATKRIIFLPTNSFYQVLSAEAYSKPAFLLPKSRITVIKTLDNKYYGTDSQNNCYSLQTVPKRYIYSKDVDSESFIIEKPKKKRKIPEYTPWHFNEIERFRQTDSMLQRLLIDTIFYNFLLFF